MPASIALWPGPRTYTGQPSAEIQTSGNPALLGLVLADGLARGARLAEPGEFTLRAFLSGRIDLTRAEAVLAVIDARSPAQLDAALNQLAGGLAGPIAALRDRLLDVLAHLEAGLDFADEDDVGPIGRMALAGDLARGASGLETLADQLRGRDRAGGRPRVVLVGPPNAGKSGLFNALIGEAKAIVSPRAGTTRDYLEAPCDCDGLAVDLVDTAGLDAADSPIEARAQALGAGQAEAADLRLDCRPIDDPAPFGPEAGPPRLLVWTKADLGPAPDHPPDAIATSARTGLGLDRLRLAVAGALRDRPADGVAPAATAARCRDSFVRAGQALRSAADALDLNGGDELVAVDLREAIDELGRVVGAVVTDDILDRIFRRFCIGK